MVLRAFYRLQKVNGIIDILFRQRGRGRILNWLHSLSFIRNTWKFYTVVVFWTLTSRSLFTFLVFKAFLMTFIKPCTQKWNFPIIVMTKLYFYPFLTLRINIYPREINFLREILVFHWCFKMSVPYFLKKWLVCSLFFQKIWLVMKIVPYKRSL